MIVSVDGGGVPRTLYVSDLDRTLLNGEGALSQRSARLLNDVVSKGALFTYATARSFDSSRRVTRDLRLNLPVITYGGTITAHPDTGAGSDIQFLEPRTVESAAQICHEWPEVEPVWHVYQDGRDWLRWPSEVTSPGLEAFLRPRHGDRRLRPITDDDPLDPATVFYVAILASRALIDAVTEPLRPTLSSTAWFVSEDVGTPGFDWLEFHHRDGTKAHAIRRLLKTTPADRLVVFGDNHNDIPMFRAADERYAVSNAVPELKAIASAVIDHHDQDAVARWIADDFARHTRLDGSTASRP